MPLFKSYIGIAMVEKHKKSKDLQTFYKFDMCIYIIKLIFYCIITWNAAKGIKNNIMQLMDMD